MVRNQIQFEHIATILVVAIILIVGYSSEDTPTNTTSSKGKQEFCDSDSQITHRKDNKDSVQTINSEKFVHNSASGLDVSINPWYDKGYGQGWEDGYEDGIENLRDDSYDDDCNYRGKKRKQYQLGYAEGYEAGFDDGFSDSDLGEEEEE